MAAAKRGPASTCTAAHFERVGVDAEPTRGEAREDEAIREGEVQLSDAPAARVELRLDDDSHRRRPRKAASAPCNASTGRANSAGRGRRRDEIGGLERRQSVRTRRIDPHTVITRCAEPAAQFFDSGAAQAYVGRPLTRTKRSRRCSGLRAAFFELAAVRL